jgi:hypothetical protein
LSFKVFFSVTREHIVYGFLAQWQLQSNNTVSRVTCYIMLFLSGIAFLHKEVYSWRRKTCSIIEFRLFWHNYFAFGPVRNNTFLFSWSDIFLFSSTELAQDELLGSLNIRRPFSVVRPHLFVNTLVVTFLPQLSLNFVRIVV